MDFSLLRLYTANSCCAIKVQSIILSLVLTHRHTHGRCCVCMCVWGGFHPSDMEGLARPKHNNGGIEEDVAPRGLVWMKGYWGFWGAGGNGDVFLVGGLLCVEILSPAAVAWHAPASGRTNSSRQCQMSCCDSEQGPLSSWGIWRGGELVGRATSDHHNTTNTTSLPHPWAACHPAASPSHALLKGNVSQRERQAVHAASTSVRTSSCQSQVTGQPVPFHETLI